MLDDEPILAEALRVAGFGLAVNPGTWSLKDVQIDLLVPSSLGGPGRRSARLGPHGTEVARKANGLEAAIVDHRVMLLRSLAPDDARSFEVAVADPAGLLVAKLHKIAERETTPDRWAPKDGLDVLRILRGVDLAQIATTLSELEVDSVAGTVTREARTYLGVLFAHRDAHGARMAVRASAGLEDAAVIALSCPVNSGKATAFGQLRQLSCPKDSKHSCVAARPTRKALVVAYGSDSETCPVRALQDRLELAGIGEGPEFRPIRGQVSRSLDAPSSSSGDDTCARWRRSCDRSGQ